MSLAFFIIAGLDLLGTLTTKTSPEERQDYIAWIYSNQLPTGGFRAFPGTNFGSLSSPENARWDPANLPATYFALSTLLILGDDLSRVKRKETLTWLRMLQRGYGSFGETLVDGVINGGEDSRFGYCAMGIRYILRGTQEGEVDGVEDVDLGRFVECIRSAETYDGGISDAPYHEAHGEFLPISACKGLSDLHYMPWLRRHEYSRLHILRPSSPILHESPERYKQTFSPSCSILRKNLYSTHKSHTRAPMALQSTDQHNLTRRRGRYLR